MRSSRPRSTTLSRSWLGRSWVAVPALAGLAALGVGTAVAVAAPGSAADSASASDHVTFTAGLELGEQVELASNGPLSYIARCAYDRSPGEDFNSGDGFIPRQEDPVVRVDVFVTSTVDGFTSNGRAVEGGRAEDGTVLPDTVDHTLAANEERRVAGTDATVRQERRFTFVGGDTSYAESNGQRFYLGLGPDSVGLGANHDRSNPGCTVVGTAFTATGTR
ncbi:MAG: hypothetical protein GEV09_11965 [Pseudonocardiaceae bacterium]|nr:hypothetical protein [Pseudonocardiaceae bacterium]